MKINDRNVGPLRPIRPPTDSREKDVPSKERAPHILPVEHNRSDRLELSAAARNLAKQALHELRQRAPHILPVDQQKRGDGPSAERAPGVLPPDNQLDGAHFSDAARKLAKEVVQALPADVRDRLQLVRQRIIGGAYDIDHVVSEVARRILERGDL